MDDDHRRASTDQPGVGAILEELRAAVRAQRLALEPQAQNPLERDLQRCLDEIELYRVVSAHWPLLGRNLPERMVMLINKLVRRYLRWYINPIVEQQNAYNDAVARTLQLLAEAYIELGEQLRNAEQRNDGRSGGDRASAGPGTSAPTADEVAAACQPPSTAHELRMEQGSLSAAPHPPDFTFNLMARVREHAAMEPPVRFPDLELRALEPQLRQRQHVTAHWPLTGQTALQRGIALVNRLVRRYLRWYINPIVEQQNAANAAFSAALLALVRLDAARRAEVARMRARRQELKSGPFSYPSSAPPRLQGGGRTEGLLH
jgi:hypothetical protein